MVVSLVLVVYSNNIVIFLWGNLCMSNKFNAKRYFKNKKLVLLLSGVVGSTAILAACNSGNSNASSNSAYIASNKLSKAQLKGIGLDELERSSGFKFDLNQRDLVSEVGKYNYKVLYLDNAMLPEESSGTLDCKSSRDCLVKIPDPKQLGQYALAVYQDDKFMGAGTFNFTSANDTRYYPSFAITPNSTGIFILKLLSLKLSNPTEMSSLPFSLVDERVRIAMGGINKNNNNIYEVSYYYFNFLLKKGLPFDQAITEFSKNITQGKIDPQFDPDRSAQDYRNYFNKYNNLNQNAQLAKLSNNFNGLASKISSAVGVSGSIIGAIYPPAAAASKGAVSGIGYIKDAFKFLADMSGSTDALNELGQLTTSIRQQSAPDTDLKDITLKISSQIDELQLNNETKVFWDYVLAINTQSNTLNYQLKGTDVDDFLRIQTDTEPRESIENMVKLYNKYNDQDGVFNGASLKSIFSSVEYITNENKLKYFIKKIKDSGLDDSNEDNLIIRREAVNDRLGVYYLDIVEATLKAYNIEKMAIYLTDRSAYRNYFSTKVALSERISGNNYDDRQKSLRALFEKRLQIIDTVFKSSVVDVYKDVPNYATLYAQGCNIKGLNSKINTLRASCPVVSSAGTVFRPSEVQFADLPNGTPTKCASNTISANADGTLTCKLAVPSSDSVASIGGGNMFYYLLDKHTSTFSSGPLYDKSAFVIGVPDSATLTLNGGNSKDNDMEYVKSHSINRFEEDGCENRFVFCTNYNYKQASSQQLPYDVLLLKNPKLEEGRYNNNTYLNPKYNITAEVIVRYNGTDYPFAIQYAAMHSAGAKEYIMNSKIRLACTSSYPTCQAVKNPDPRYIENQRLKFSSPKGGFTTTIGVTWDDRGNALRVPRLVINP